MLFEDDRRGNSRFKTVRGARADDAAKAAERFTAPLSVVRKRVQPALHRLRRPEARNQTPLALREGKRRRIRRLRTWERELL